MSINAETFSPGCELEQCPDSNRLNETIAGKVALSVDHLKQSLKNLTTSLVCTSAKIDCDGAVEFPVIKDGEKALLRMCGVKVTEISVNIGMR